MSDLWHLLFKLLTVRLSLDHVLQGVVSGSRVVIIILKEANLTAPSSEPSANLQVICLRPPTNDGPLDNYAVDVSDTVKTLRFVCQKMNV